MKKFLILHFKDTVLFMCMLFIFICVICVSELFVQANEIESQSTEGFGSEKIEFVLDTTDIVDFSFLEECSDEKFAIVKRENEFEPIYDLVSTYNFFYIEETSCPFSLDTVNEEGKYYICGSKAADLFDINPFKYKEIEFKEYGKYATTSSESKGLDYMIFLFEKDHLYYGKNNFILIGNHKSVDRVFDSICNNTGDIHIYKKDVREATIGDRETLGEKGGMIILISMALVILGLILIVYWWYLQYEEYRRACLILGKRNHVGSVLRDFSLILVMSFALSFFICLESKVFIKILVFVPVSCLSLLLVLVIGMVGADVAYDAKEI